MKYEFLAAETMNGTPIDKGLRNKDLIKEGNLGGTEINLTLTVDEAKAIINLVNLSRTMLKSCMSLDPDWNRVTGGLADHALETGRIGNDIKHYLNDILEFEEYK